MIEKKVKVLRDYKLKTYFGYHYLSKGEVKRIRFKDHFTFEAQVSFGNLVEAERDELEAKNLSVVLPELKPGESDEEIPIEEQLVNLPELKPGESDVVVGD